MNIIVNGRQHTIHHLEVCYFEIKSMAGDPLMFADAPTIVYRKGVGGAEGILPVSKCVLVADGMIFNVADTSSA